MTGWFIDHWWIAIVAVAAALGAGLWIAVSGGTACPKGQSSQFAYFQPVISQVGKATIVTNVPVYTCQPDR